MYSFWAFAFVTVRHDLRQRGKEQTNGKHMFYPTTDHISNCYLVVTRNRHFCREIDALFSRRFLAFPASVKTACASLNLRPHLLLLSIKSACGGGSNLSLKKRVNDFRKSNLLSLSSSETWAVFNLQYQVEYETKKSFN